MSTKVRVIRNDPVGRFKVGEEGVLLDNDFSNMYDFFVRLDPVSVVGSEGSVLSRDYYLQSDQIEILKDTE